MGFFTLFAIAYGTIGIFAATVAISIIFYPENKKIREKDPNIQGWVFWISLLILWIGIMILWPLIFINKRD